MTAVGITMVKDEADIVGYTLQYMLDQVDSVIVADNGSTDNTRSILTKLKAHAARGLAKQLVVMDDDEPGYYQSLKMSTLAKIAYHDFGASWVIPFDADEFWYSPHGRIGDVLEGMPDDVAVVQAPLYNHLATGKDDRYEKDPFARMGWRWRAPGALPKVACRPVLPVTIEQGNHGAAYPDSNIDAHGVLVVRHFPYRSAEQMTRKARNGAAAYKATDLPEHEGQHWREYGAMTDEQLEGVFERWFFSAHPAEDATLIHDPAPSCLPPSK